MAFLTISYPFMRTIFAVLMLGLTLSVNAQRTAPQLSATPAYQAQDARTFGLSVIQKHYEGKCAEVFALLDSEIIAFENGARFQKSQFTVTDFCSEDPFNSAITVNDYNTYLANFTTEVLDHTEFAQKFPNFWIQLEPGDFYFNGTVKTGNVEVFKISDMARFILRSAGNGQYVIISI
jgi:hypothetical protein